MNPTREDISILNVMLCILMIIVFRLCFYPQLPETASAAEHLKGNIARGGHIKTFINFGSDPSFIAGHYDITFNKAAKKYNDKITAINYGLIATMVVPSDKSRMSLDYCGDKNIANTDVLYEDMFLHLAEDVQISLYAGKEGPGNKIETRIVPGWDEKNDINGDGILDDWETRNPVNKKATARSKQEARLPVYYWGPPNRDYVMNIGNRSYVEFFIDRYLPELCKGYDGIFFDTLTKTIPFNTSGLKIIEYPDQKKWKEDLEALLKRAVLSVQGKIIIGNGWDNDPFIIHGVEWENAFSITKDTEGIYRCLEAISDPDKRDRMQLVQYNPIDSIAAYDRTLSGLLIDEERDMIFGLSLFYLINAENTYFGRGMHPYSAPENYWFPAMEYDVGEPNGAFYTYLDGSAEIPNDSDNAVINGDFETSEHDKGLGWDNLKHSMIVKEGCGSGMGCAYISSTQTECNKIEQQRIRLKPNTGYTLIYSIRTEGVTGAQGAQVYLTGIEDASFMEGNMDDAFPFYKGTKTWTTYRTVFHTAEETDAYIKFRIRNTAGEVWLDDISLVEGSYPAWKIFARDYTNALVLVKLGPLGMGTGDETATTYTLKGRFKVLKEKGDLGVSMTSVRLKNREGAILIKDE